MDTQVMALIRNEPTELAIPSIATFKDALEGRIPYDSTLPAIEYWEWFLILWVMDEEIQKKEEHMQLMFDELRDVFGYTGTIWKGIWRKDKEPLLPVTLSSFTNEREVALWFVGASRTYGYFHEELEPGLEQVLIQVKAERALAIDDLMMHLQNVSTNGEFGDVLDRREWEKEKIYPLTANDLQTSIVI